MIEMPDGYEWADVPGETILPCAIHGNEKLVTKILVFPRSGTDRGNRGNLQICGECEGRRWPYVQGMFKTRFDLKVKEMDLINDEIDKMKGQFKALERAWPNP